MARIERSARAERDLVDLWKYIAMESGDPARADTLLDRIESRLATLSQYPLSGKRRPDLSTDIRSVAVGTMVVYYLPLPDGIEVVRVLHGARDVDAALLDDEV